MNPLEKTIKNHHSLVDRANLTSAITLLKGKVFQGKIRNQSLGDNILHGNNNRRNWIPSDSHKKQILESLSSSNNWEFAIKEYLKKYWAKKRAEHSQSMGNLAGMNKKNNNNMKNNRKRFSPPNKVMRTNNIFA